MHNLHVVTIESKRRITVSEAKEVIAFSDKEIKLNLKDGSILTVIGSELKITAFDDGSGLFTAVGSVLSTKYKQPVTTFIKKVLG